MNETKANLLIVDDEPSIRMSLSHVLAEIGYRVRTAEDDRIGCNQRRSPGHSCFRPEHAGHVGLRTARQRAPSLSRYAHHRHERRIFRHGSALRCCCRCLLSKGQQPGLTSEDDRELALTRPCARKTANRSATLAAIHDVRHNLSEASATARRQEASGTLSQTVN